MQITPINIKSFLFNKNIPSFSRIQLSLDLIIAVLVFITSFNSSFYLLQELILILLYSLFNKGLLLSHCYLSSEYHRLWLTSSFCYWSWKPLSSAFDSWGGLLDSFVLLSLRKFHCHWSWFTISSLQWYNLQYRHFYVKLWYQNYDNYI